MSPIALAVQLLGLAAEIVGVLLMAHVSLSMVEGKRGKLGLLWFALIKGKGARSAAELQRHGFEIEDRLVTLQGLALIALGFLTQAIGVLLAYVLASEPPSS